MYFLRYPHLSVPFFYPFCFLSIKAPSVDEMSSIVGQTVSGDPNLKQKWGFPFKYFISPLPQKMVGGERSTLESFDNPSRRTNFITPFFYIRWEFFEIFQWLQINRPRVWGIWFEKKYQVIVKFDCDNMTRLYSLFLTENRLRKLL